MKHGRGRIPRRGMALPVILVVIVLLAIMAASVQFLIRSQSGQVQRIRLKHQAFFQAEAGYEYAVGKLVDGAASAKDRWYWKDGGKRSGLLSLSMGGNEAQIFVADVCNAYGVLSHMSIFSKGTARHRGWSRAVLFRGNVRLNGVKGGVEAVEISRGAVDVRRLVERLKKHRDFYANGEKARALERKNPHYMPGKGRLVRIGVVPEDSELDGRIDSIIRDLERMVDDDAEDGSGPDLSDPAVQRALEALLRRDDAVDAMLRTVRIHGRRKTADRLDEFLHGIPTDMAPDDFFKGLDESWRVSPLDLDAAFDAFGRLSDEEVDLARIEDNLMRMANLPADLRVWPRGIRATFNPQEIAAAGARTLHGILAGFRTPVPPGFGRIFEGLTEKAGKGELVSLVPSYGAALPQGAAVLVPAPGAAGPPPEVGTENPGLHPAEQGQAVPDLTPEPTGPSPDGTGIDGGVTPPSGAGPTQAPPGSSPSEAAMDQMDSQASNAADTPQGADGGMGSPGGDLGGNQVATGGDAPPAGTAAPGDGPAAGDPADGAVGGDPGDLGTPGQPAAQGAPEDGGAPADPAAQAPADAPADPPAQAAPAEPPAEKPALSPEEVQQIAYADKVKAANMTNSGILKDSGPDIKETYPSYAASFSNWASGVFDSVKEVGANLFAAAKETTANVWNSMKGLLGGDETGEGAGDGAAPADGAPSGDGATAGVTGASELAGVDGPGTEPDFSVFGVVPDGYSLPEEWGDPDTDLSPEYFASQQEKYLGELKDSMTFRAENYSAFGPLLPEGVEPSQENVFADGLANIASVWGDGASAFKDSIALMATSVAQSVGGALAGLSFTGDMIKPYPVAGGLDGAGGTTLSPSEFLGGYTGAAAAAGSAGGTASAGAGSAMDGGLPGGDGAAGTAVGDGTAGTAVAGTGDSALGGGTDGGGALGDLGGTGSALGDLGGTGTATGTAPPGGTFGGGGMQPASGGALGGSMAPSGGGAPAPALGGGGVGSPPAAAPAAAPAGGGEG